MTFLNVFLLDLKDFGIKGKLSNACIRDGIFRVESLQKLKVGLMPEVNHKECFILIGNNRMGKIKKS